MIMITARQALTADAEFARHSNRYRLQIFVEDVSLHVADRLANRRNSCDSRGIHGRISRDHGILGWPVMVDELKGQRLPRHRLQLVSSREQETQRETRRSGFAKDGFGKRSGKKTDCNSFLGKPFQ